ncbi:hypothetical protein ACFVFS_08935 [Kitasatospora sp. NPDC057692]|uniref:hypothetical protein n=1 Tax=Kitasatospora sp. NPDC057692 TaxID=3346215 RepID=UPI00369B03CE
MEWTRVRRVLIALLVLAAAPAGWMLWSLHSLFSTPDPPDLRALTKAPATVEARRAAEQDTGGRIARLPELLPWAERLGMSTVDVCWTEVERASFGRAYWTPPGCERTVTLYLALDTTDIRTRLADLDRYLDAEGWQSDDYQWKSLIAADDYAHSPGGDPSPERLAEAAARPIAPSVRYRQPSAGARTALSVDVSQTTRPLNVSTGEDTWYAEHGTRNHRNDDRARAEYLTWQPLRPMEVLKPAGGRYVAVLGFSTRYAQEEWQP